MKLKISIAILFLCCVSTSNAANILAIYTLASPSQQLLHSHLLVELANRGHNVTVLSPQGQKKPVPNLTDMVVPELYDSVASGYSYESMTENSNYYWIKETYVFLAHGCMVTLKSKAFQQLLDYPKDTKFDLIIMESSGTECLLGILPKFGNPPIVGVHGLSIPPWVLEISGTPTNPAYTPYYYLPYEDKMKFIERVYNFLAYAYTHYIYNYDYLPKMDQEAKNFFGPDTQSVYETVHNISVNLANVHPALDSAISFPPNVIPIAGIQVRDPNPLPQDLQKFLDEATEGAIFFSFGTNVRSDRLLPETRKAILEAFAEIPQRVLWKFESDLTGVPDNVKIGKFFPQNDILAHPNVRVFITHAGLLSTQEAVARGVPVIGVPFIVDQHTNILRMKARGCGVLLEYKHITKDSLLRALREVLDNPSYRQNMQKLSSVFTDQPQSPLERAVFWTEYVIRHKGAPFFRSGAKDLNWIQYLLLDVLAFLIGVPVLTVYLLYSVFIKRKSKVSKKEKKH